MSAFEQHKKRFQDIATEILSTFEKIVHAASTKIEDSRQIDPVTRDSFAHISADNLPSALSNITNIRSENYKSYIVLNKEPARVRVVVRDDSNQETAYYICRSAALALEREVPDIKLAGYKTKFGRLAELSIGEELDIDGKYLTIVEKTKLSPQVTTQIIDSRPSIFESETYTPLTIKSLRALIRKKEKPIDENLLAKQLLEDEDELNIQEGIRRNVIEKMSLRDQFDLDKYQGGIFRLPLDSQLLILGPPGTGKTTTLIKRLGQKLDAEFLTTDEKKLLHPDRLTEHAQSWLMFTPTELLRQYVKEAFNRENVSASDYHIKTWSDYRFELARDKFGLLNTP